MGYVKKNLLNGLNIPDFKIMKPVARNWLETVANVRTHGETGKRPVDMFAEEKTSLQPLPAEPCDIAVIKQMRASRQFRITIDTNPVQCSGPTGRRASDRQNVSGSHLFLP